MTNKRAQGIFISRFQKSWIPQDHQDYVIVKCTDGYDKDPLYNPFSTTAKNEGKLLGATHYLRSALDWENQVDTFLECSQNADFLSIDFEGIGNTESKEFAVNSQYALQRTREKSKKKTAFYSSIKYVQEWMYPYGVYWIREEPDFWCAQWPFSFWDNRLLEIPYPDKGWYPRLPAGCTQSRFWQYGAEYLERGAFEGVGSKHVCLEVFLGTVDELKTWCNKQPEVPEISLKCRLANLCITVGEFLNKDC